MTQREVEEQAGQYESQALAFDYRAKRARDKHEARQWVAEAKRLRGLARGLQVTQ